MKAIYDFIGLLFVVVVFDYLAFLIVIIFLLSRKKFNIPYDKQMGVIIGLVDRRNPDLRLFCVSMMARRDCENKWAVYTKPCSCVARSYEEAIGLGLVECKNCYPESDGFSEHKVDALEFQRSNLIYFFNC